MNRLRIIGNPYLRARVYCGIAMMEGFLIGVGRRIFKGENSSLRSLKSGNQGSGHSLFEPMHPDNDEQCLRMILETMDASTLPKQTGEQFTTAFFGVDFLRSENIAATKELSKLFFKYIVVREFFRLRIGKKPGFDGRVMFEASRFCNAADRAFAFGATRQQVHADAFISSILVWAKENPAGFGIGWVNAMEAAIRVANWCMGFRMLVECGAVGETERRRIENIIIEHGLFIMSNLESVGGVRNNHYLADITGLLYIGALLPHLRFSARWRAFAIKELIGEASRQFMDDGCAFESSTCYHRLSAELLFCSAIVAIRTQAGFTGDNYAELCSEIFGSSFTKILNGIIATLKFLLKPDGTLPQIGDNDSGRLHDFTGRNAMDARHLLSMGCVFFREPSFKVREHGWCPEIRPFLGTKEAMYYQLESGISMESIGCASFPDAGWYILRHGTDYCFITSGTRHRRKYSGHAHNDALSCDITMNGHALFADPGSYIYMGDQGQRDLFRSTGMHNTLCIGNLEQNEIAGAGLFSMKQGVVAGDCAISETAEYALFIGAVSYGGCSHEREILYSKVQRTFTITDCFRTPAAVAGVKELHFHLYPGYHLSNDSIVISRSGYVFATFCAQSDRVRTEPYDYSPVYGAKLPAERIVITIDGFESGHRTRIIPIEHP